MPPEKDGDEQQEQQEQQEQEEQQGVVEGEEQEEKSGEGGEPEVKQFYNPNEVPPELRGAWNKMQGAFTRAMQGVASEKQKAEMFDKLSSGDIEGVVQSLAKRAGLKVTKEGEVVEKPNGAADDSPTAKYIRGLIQNEIAPLVQMFREGQARMQTESLISNLQTNFPDWKLYENEMAAILETHPSLRHDPAKLYRLAKAEADEVESGLKTTNKSEKVLTKTPSGRQSRVVPKKAESLDDAIALAKQQLNIKD